MAERQAQQPLGVPFNPYPQSATQAAGAPADALTPQEKTEFNTHLDSVYTPQGILAAKEWILKNVHKGKSCLQLVLERMSTNTDPTFRINILYLVSDSLYSCKVDQRLQIPFEGMLMQLFTAASTNQNQDNLNFLKQLIDTWRQGRTFRDDLLASLAMILESLTQAQAEQEKAQKAAAEAVKQQQQYAQILLTQPQPTAGANPYEPLVRLAMSQVQLAAQTARAQGLNQAQQTQAWQSALQAVATQNGMIPQDLYNLMLQFQQQPAQQVPQTFPGVGAPAVAPQAPVMGMQQFPIMQQNGLSMVSPQPGQAPQQQSLQQHQMLQQPQQPGQQAQQQLQQQLQQQQMYQQLLQQLPPQQPQPQLQQQLQQQLNPQQLLPLRPTKPM